MAERENDGVAVAEGVAVAGTAPLAVAVVGALRLLDNVWDGEWVAGSEAEAVLDRDGVRVWLREDVSAVLRESVLDNVSDVGLKPVGLKVFVGTGVTVTVVVNVGALPERLRNGLDVAVALAERERERVRESVCDCGRVAVAVAEGCGERDWLMDVEGLGMSE